MHLELMASLLNTERQYRTMSKRIGIFDALEKCFDSSSRTEEEAIAHAQRRYQAKRALNDPEEFKRILQEDDSAQLNLTQVKPQANSWAAAKFGKHP